MMNGHRDKDSDRIEDTTPPPREAGNVISLIELFNIILKNRRLILITSLTIFALVTGYAFLKARTFSTSASFLPQSTSNQGSLTANLAAQLGVFLPTGEAGQSLEFYAELISSPEILRDLAEKTYESHYDDVPGPTSLPVLFKIDEDTRELTREMMMRKLEKIISVTTDRETGLVTFAVQTRWPDISAGISSDILYLVNQFNLETRQTQARMERVFVEARLKQTQSELRTAEDTLEEFLLANRQYERDPELVFIFDRLSREVLMRQQIFTSLNQAYEQARIDEVRDTPVITIFEQPEAAVLPDSRRLISRGLLALIVGGILGIFNAFGRDFMIRGHQQEADHFAEFVRLKRDTLHDLKNPLRLLTK